MHPSGDQGQFFSNQIRTLQSKHCLREKQNKERQTPPSPAQRNQRPSRSSTVAAAAPYAAHAAGPGPSGYPGARCAVVLAGHWSQVECVRVAG